MTPSTFAQADLAFRLARLIGQAAQVQVMAARLACEILEKPREIITPGGGPLSKAGTSQESPDAPVGPLPSVSSISKAAQAVNDFIGRQGRNSG